MHDCMYVYNYVAIYVCQYIYICIAYVKLIQYSVYTHAWNWFISCKVGMTNGA